MDDSQMVIDIIDEIIEACVNGTSIPDYVNELLCSEIAKLSDGNDFNCADRSNAGMLQHNSNITAVEVVALDQLKALNKDDKCLASNDEHLIMNDKCTDNDKDLDGRAEQDNNGAVEADCKRLKDFSCRTMGTVRVAVNVHLEACAKKISKYELKCEGLPPKMMEDELALMFAKFGDLYKVMKNTKTNKVYAIFTNAKAAENAIESLDGTHIQEHRVKLNKQLPNRRLIVRNIPKSATKKELFQKFHAIHHGLVSVSLYNDQSNENLNRGFCYLEYSEHHHAAEAKTKLSSICLFNIPTVVEWPDRCFEWMETPDTLYINNLRSSIGSSDLQRIFSAYGQLINVLKVDSFAKIKFRNVEDAKRAASEVNKSALGNENVEISSLRLTKDDEPKIEPNTSDTLQIRNLSATVSAKDLRTIFGLYGNVLDIDINRNESCAFVRFQLHEQAKRASLRMDKHQLGRDFAISLFNRTAVDKPSDTVYISNLRSKISTVDLRKWFAVYGEVTEIDVRNDSATIRFLHPANAERAARNINKQCMGDRVQISLNQSSENRVQKNCPPMSNTLYIYNMYADMNATRLKKLFSVYGKLISVDLQVDYGTVQFHNGNDAIRAAHQINRVHLGRTNPEIFFFPKNL